MKFKINILFLLLYLGLVFMILPINYVFAEEENEDEDHFEDYKKSDSDEITHHYKYDLDDDNDNNYDKDDGEKIRYSKEISNPVSSNLIEEDTQIEINNVSSSNQIETDLSTTNTTNVNNNSNLSMNIKLLNSKLEKLKGDVDSFQNNNSLNKTSFNNYQPTKNENLTLNESFFDILLIKINSFLDNIFK